MNSHVSFVALLVVAASTIVSVADGYCIWYGHCGNNPLYNDTIIGGIFGGKPLNRYDNTEESSALLLLIISYFI